ncbi:MAG: hypothetical protein A2103_05080 [Gammaproteobacteria bacterium GWF2_41_13]|nr:MAG: hypothetical protein A2103_05080 [Gammaproteobacteria bacterium GWF2_41_13]
MDQRRKEVTNFRMWSHRYHHSNVNCLKLTPLKPKKSQVWLVVFVWVLAVKLLLTTVALKSDSYPPQR